MEHINLLGFLASICHYICKLMSVMNLLSFILIAYIMFVCDGKNNRHKLKKKRQRFGVYRHQP